MKTILTAGVLLAAATTTAQALPVQFSGNGNYYEIVDAGSIISQSAAVTAAAGMSFGGQTGYLATITSASEQAFVNTLLAGFNVWIGLNDAVTDGDFVWLDGPEAGDSAVYTNWASVGTFTEPNGGASEEAVFLTGTAGLTGAGYAEGAWVDVFESGAAASSIAHVTGYVVEYAAPIPLPAAGLMLLMGLGGLAAVRRQKG